MPAELTRRFERRSRTYEARALPTELHQHNFLEAAGRIALPMICSAGRRLAVLATPPQLCSRSSTILLSWVPSGLGPQDFACGLPLRSRPQNGSTGAEY